MVKKKSALIPVALRRSMVSSEDVQFSMTQQCQMLGIHRSGVYYKPAKASERDLEIMRIMDALYLEDPARGTRRYRDDLRHLGHLLPPSNHSA
jgi:putative transposase